MNLGDILALKIYAWNSRELTKGHVNDGKKNAER